MRSDKIIHLRRIAARKQAQHCYYCNYIMSRQHPQLSCTAEHLIPRSNSGKDTRSNIVAACKFCNSMRHRQYSGVSPSDYVQIVRRLVGLKMWHQYHSAWPSLA